MAVGVGSSTLRIDISDHDINEKQKVSNYILYIYIPLLVVSAKNKLSFKKLGSRLIRFTLTTPTKLDHLTEVFEHRQKVSV